VLPLDAKQGYHLATFGRGDFFGEMSFLDREPRSADAIAFTDAELFVLSREHFDALADEHKKLAMQLREGLARALAIRLRHSNTELRALQEDRSPRSIRSPRQPHTIRQWGTLPAAE